MAASYHTAIGFCLILYKKEKKYIYMYDIVPRVI